MRNSCVLWNRTTSTTTAITWAEAMRLMKLDLAEHVSDNIFVATELGLLQVKLPDYEAAERDGMDPELLTVWRTSMTEYRQWFYEGQGRAGGWMQFEAWRNAHDDREWVLHA